MREASSGQEKEKKKTSAPREQPVKTPAMSEFEEAKRKIKEENKRRFAKSTGDSIDLGGRDDLVEHVLTQMQIALEVDLGIFCRR